MAFKSSFPPFIPNNARILILGSLPGDTSLERNQYYAHPNNRFWKVLSTLFNSSTSDKYDDKLNLLSVNRIALWDVAASAHRPGSMDADIKHVEPNDLIGLLNANPTIKTIVFNGTKANQMYDRFFERLDGIKYWSLPSTSPANARFQMDKLLENWRQIKE